MRQKETLKKAGLLAGLLAAGIMGFASIGCGPDEPEAPTLPDEPAEVPQPEPLPEPQPDDGDQQFPELPELP